MEVIPIIYLSYMFVSVYFLALFLIIYYRNKDTINYYPKMKKAYSLSVIIPAYNEAETIKETIEHVFELDYPNMLEVIVVNDCSTDNTRKVVENLQKRFPKLILINNKKNLGNAARTKNVGLSYAKGEIIATTDADSYPEKNSVKQMIGFFEDEKVGAVTCSIFVRNSKTNLLCRMQSIEYKVIAFMRKLLGYVDAIYVTPGPLALYRKSAIEDIGRFDDNNLTEDIEITWRLIDKGWKREMSLPAQVSSTAPEKFGIWYRQRRRWSVGGFQCIAKYKKQVLKRGMLGLYVLPFFILQFFLGVVGLGVFLYLFITKLITNFLFVNYSISAKVPLLTINRLFITLDFLNYLGLILFVVGTGLTFFILSKMKNTSKDKESFFSIMIYSLFYMTIYPVLAVIAIYKYFKRDDKW